MERLKEWNNSADLYQEILTNPQYATKVVPSHEDADHRIDQYTSVIDLVMQRLSRWPEEGLSVSRARYERRPRHCSNRPREMISSRCNRYSAGISSPMPARPREFGWWTMIWRPASFVPPPLTASACCNGIPTSWRIVPRCSYRAAIAYHLAGDGTAAQARLAELKKRDPDAKGTVRGKDVVLAVAG